MNPEEEVAHEKKEIEVMRSVSWFHNILKSFVAVQSMMELEAGFKIRNIPLNILSIRIVCSEDCRSSLNDVGTNLLHCIVGLPTAIM